MPDDCSNQLSANNVDGDTGVITYTQWLNETGRIEADLTVTKLDDDRFWVVATDTAHRHVETRMRRHFGDQHAIVTDVTSWVRAAERAGPAIAGVAAVASHPPTCRTRRSRSARRAYIDIGFAQVLCVRITYLGELGYELYVSAEQAVHVYDRIVAAGRVVRTAPCGVEGAGQPADGEGVPRLRPRHRQHRFGARSRPRLCRRSRQARRLHRSRRGGSRTRLQGH